MVFLAPAKINLFLDVIRKRDDGYHEINTLFERVSILDRLTIEETSGGTTITCDDPRVPTDKQSLLGRTVEEFNKASGPEKHFRVTVEKNIPIGAGLGGGSSDAATLLKGLNEVSGTPLTQMGLVKIGARLGSDVPFFLSGHRFAYGTGRGEVIKGLDVPLELWHVLVNPGFEVSTREVYGKLSGFAHSPRLSPVLPAKGGPASGRQNGDKRRGSGSIGDKPIGELTLTKNECVDTMNTAFLSARGLLDPAKNLRNDLQTIVLRDFPVLGKVFDSMKLAGAKGVLLSGSGPTVFGIFDKDNVMEAADRIRFSLPKDIKWNILVARTY